MTPSGSSQQTRKSGLPRGLIIFFAVHFAAFFAVAIFLMWKFGVFG